MANTSLIIFWMLWREFGKATSPGMIGHDICSDARFQHIFSVLLGPDLLRRFNENDAPEHCEEKIEFPDDIEEVVWDWTGRACNIRQQREVKPVFKKEALPWYKFVVIIREDGKRALATGYGGSYHKEIADTYFRTFECYDEEGRRLPEEKDASVEGGGFLKVVPEKKIIELYGNSESFGDFDPDTATSLVREAMDNEGYGDWKLEVFLHKERAEPCRTRLPYE